MNPKSSMSQITATSFGVLFAITTLSLVVCANTTITSADSATASVNVSAACVMTATDIAHSSDIIPNQWTPNIGQSNLTAVCNDPGGYAIYAIGYTNNEYGNTNLINTSDSTKTIVTGPNKSGNTSNWSMKLGKGTGESATIEGEEAGDTEDFYTDYHIIPSTYTKVAKKTDATSSTTSGTSLTTTYGVFTTTTQIAGTYEGQVKYTLVHPSTEPAPWYPRAETATPQCISYWPNAGDVADSMDDQCSFGNNATVSSLWASNFQRPGYGFAGWTDKFDWELNQNDQNGNGTGVNEGYHIYGPNATITTPDDMTTNGLSLYAVWVPSAGNLQGWTGCSNLNTGQITALTDTRDNNTYTVAKLKDNKCWMVENLRLDDQYTTSAENIAKAQGYNSSFVGLAAPETANFSNSTTANSLYSVDGSTSAPSITGNYAAYRFPRYNNQNTDSPISNMTTIGANIYSYGNYYTWSAAIADTTRYSSGNHNTTSICPTGWHIPTGTSSGEYYTLNTEQNSGATDTSAGLRAYPANFIYSGYFGSSSANWRGDWGYYRSSSVFDDYNSYTLHFQRNGRVGPGTYSDASSSYKNMGFSIRCSCGS